MDNTDDLTPVDEPEVQINPVMHLVAPIAAIAVTMIVRKVVNSAYQKTTGRPAPEARDPQVSFMRAIMWTALITTSAAVAEVVVYRMVNMIGEKPVD
mgnify:CR=1 FL=1|jgi:hypothetical protein